MSIKITEKMLIIPPYISTSWKRVASLHMEGSTLVIILNEGSAVQVPNLEQEILNSIFHHHSQFLEKIETDDSMEDPVDPRIRAMLDTGEPSIRFAFGSPMDGLGSMIQHNPDQADSPDLPSEILQKIGAISKIVAPAEENISLPKAVPHCNCFHCQIARVLKPNKEDTQQNEEQEISAEDLQFEQWIITHTGDQLYSVINKLDDSEQYNVYLGEPIGCTCGQTGCEHLLAVLKS